MTDRTKTSIFFSEFEIDAERRRLLRSGEQVALNSKAFDLLLFLAGNSGRNVSKEEILESVWDGKFVEESNLVVQISNLRKALNDSISSPKFLVTVPGTGYRFVGVTSATETATHGEIVSEVTIRHEEEITIEHSSVGVSRPVMIAAGLSVGVLLLVASVFVYRAVVVQTPVKAHSPRLARITTSGAVSAIAATPDGRYAVIAQKDPGGESLWLRHLETGSQTRIAETRPVQYVGLTIEPDSEFIYASVFSKNEIDPVVVRMPLTGGPGVNIANVTTGASVSISPDKQRIAFTTSNNRQRQTLMGVADIDGGNLRYLVKADHDTRYINNFQSGPVAWTPDGRSIALAVNDKADGETRSAVIIVDPETGSEKHMTEKRWTGISHIAWIDADRLALIATDEENPEEQVWLVSRAGGEYSRVSNDVREYTWLAASSGRVLATQRESTTSIRIAEVDSELTTATTSEVFSGSDEVDEIDWDSEGNLVFVSRSNGNPEIWRMDADGGNRKQLTNEANVAYGLTVSPQTGKIYYAAKIKGSRGIWSANSDGSDPQRVTSGSDQLPDSSADGNVVFHRGLGYADGVFIIENGNSTPRLLREKCYFPAISPDGHQTACYFMDWEEGRMWNIALVDNSTGELVKKIKVPIPVFERQIRFHPSGKYITQIYTNGESLQMLLMPLDGTSHRVIEGLGKGSSNLPEWSPDGKRFVYPEIHETHDMVMFSELKAN
jgi:Tol biopolymer transport system component/DNA-binding winged helix-turn-helix (wHTH) protein